MIVITIPKPYTSFQVEVTRSQTAEQTSTTLNLSERKAVVAVAGVFTLSDISFSGARTELRGCLRLSAWKQESS